MEPRVHDITKSRYNKAHFLVPSVNMSLYIIVIATLIITKFRYNKVFFFQSRAVRYNESLLYPQ